MYLALAAIVFSMFCWTMFVLYFRKDRSRYRNCYLLSLALLSLFPLAVGVLGRYSSMPVMLTLWLGLLIILIVPFFLIFNGIVMIRKEGRHLSQLLSLVFGIAILIGELITFGGILRYAALDGKEPFIPQTFIAVFAALFSFTVIYGSVSFLIFMIYTLFLQIIPRKKDFDFVIIHGAGLLDGDRVSKLLQDRLDKAIEVYKADPTPPKLIPSGGKGSDETISEAEAMTQYLVSRGVPEEDILPEDQSTTTLENLQFSKKIMDTYDCRKYTALVTSNYHVYRALRYCREIGLKCTGIGSHVAWYFWPSALIREYIAIHMEKKHFILFAGGWLACVAFLMYLIYQ